MLCSMFRMLHSIFLMLHDMIRRLRGMIRMLPSMFRTLVDMIRILRGMIRMLLGMIRMLHDMIRMLRNMIRMLHSLRVLPNSTSGKQFVWASWARRARALDEAEWWYSSDDEDGDDLRARRRWREVVPLKSFFNSWRSAMRTTVLTVLLPENLHTYFELSAQAWTLYKGP